MVLKSHKTSGRKELLLISILDFQLRTSKLLPVHGWRVGMVVRCIPKWHRNAMQCNAFQIGSSEHSGALQDDTI